MPSVRPLPPSLAKAAEEELNEDPQRLEADLSHLRDWISKQPHLKARTDDQFLVAFLRGAKFSLERAKEKLDSYYTLRTACPEFFANVNPSAPMMKKISSLRWFLPLGEDSDGRRVVLVRLALHDPKEINFEDLLKHEMMILDTMMMEDDTFMVKGISAILDHQGITMNHVGQYLPSLIKKAFTVYQEGYPVRIKALHYYNMPNIFEKVFNFLKSVMKEKIRDRVFIHSDLKSLQEKIPKDILPEEYGGDAGTCEEIADRLADHLLARRDFFAEEANFGTNEHLRPGKPRTSEELFGVDGSFRSLTVD